MTSNIDPERIVNEPSRGFLGYLGPSIRCTRKGNSSTEADGSATELIHMSVNGFFWMELITKPLSADSPSFTHRLKYLWTSWSLYDTHLQFFLSEWPGLLPMKPPQGLPQYAVWSRWAAHWAEMLTRRYWERHQLCCIWCQRAWPSLVATLTPSRPLAGTAQRHVGNYLFWRFMHWRVISMLSSVRLSRETQNHKWEVEELQ